MPQMSPMNWLMLMLMFMFMYLILMVYIYFFFIHLKYLNKIYNKVSYELVWY